MRTGGSHDLSKLSPETRARVRSQLKESILENDGAGDLTIAQLVEQSYEIAKLKGWWDEEKEGEADRCPGTMIMLMVTELSEAFEEYRNGREVTEIWYRDDGKPEGVPTEFADVLIRIGDYCGKHNIPLARAVQEKLAFNKTRPFRHGNKRC